MIPVKESCNIIPEILNVDTLTVSVNSRTAKPSLRSNTEKLCNAGGVTSGYHITTDESLTSLIRDLMTLDA